VFTKIFPLICVIAATASLSSQGVAKDFVSLLQDINRFSETVEGIELAAGRHDFALVEPLHMLGKNQFKANLFSDAEASVDRAIQIARFSDGLYTPIQYPLLQVAIEIELARENWSKVDEKLEHFTWLVSQQYQGKVKPRIEQAQWIANVRLKVFYGDDAEMRAPHLINVTYLRETTVQYAQAMRLTDDPLYHELLFELANAYRLEAEAIRAGGSTSYQLRRLFPGLDIIEEKRLAVDKRYRIGLEKLQMLQRLIEVDAAYDYEASVMMHLYIAKWHGFFNKHEQRGVAIADALTRLVQSEQDEASVLALLDHPTGLSWERLQLELETPGFNLVSGD